MRPDKILYIPGWGSGKTGQAPLLERLRTRYQVDVLWLPDLGSNGWEPSQPFDRLYLDGLRDRITREEGTVAIVGWSLGGMAALELSASLPDRVTHLALISTTARFCADSHNAIGAAVADVERMLAELPDSAETVLRRFFALCCRPDTSHKTLVDRKTTEALDASTEQLALGLNFLLSADLRPVLSQITCPTLILHGAEDRIVPVQAARELHRQLPGSKLAIASGKGHLLPDYSPDFMADHILAFTSSN